METSNARVSRGTCAASGKGGGDFSECWGGYIVLPGGRMILCRYILGGRICRERRERSGLPLGVHWAAKREGGGGYKLYT